MRCHSPHHRPRSRFRGIGVSAAIVTAAALILSGCTSARDSQPAGASSTPVNGGALTVAVALDAQPSGVFGTLDRNLPWQDDVFENLIRLDPKTRAIEPVLATKVDVATDGKSATITLRKGVTFQTGRPFTADDVKFSFDKSKDPANGYNLAFVAKQFTSVTVDDPTKLTIAFAKPLGDAFLDYLNQTPIVDSATYAGLADGSKVVGTGPFSFGDWKPGASFTLTKYSGYRDAKDIHLDKVDYVVTSDPTAEINAVKSGRAQIAYGLTASNAQAFAKNTAYSMMDGAGSIFPLGINVTTAPLDDKRVRQAIAYAIDSKRINQQVFAGTGTVTDLPWPSDAAGNSKALQSHYSYDPAKAKKLIQEAGATGAKVSITYNRSNASVNAEYQIVANNLQAIGLDPVANGEDQPTYQAAQTNATIPQTFLTIHAQGGLSPSTLVQSLPTLRAGNASHMNTPEYVQLSAALATATGAQQTSALKALSDYMLDQAFFDTLVMAPDVVVVSKTVGDVDVSSLGMFLFGKAYVTG